MKPIKVVMLALLAALLGLAAVIFIAGPGILLRTEIGQALFERLVPPKYPVPGGGGAIGDTVRPFTVIDFGGSPRTLPTSGRWQVINYWASWCGPCRLEMPWLDTLHADNRGRFEVIGIALEAPDAATTVLTDIPVRFTQHHEPPGASDSSVHLGNGWGCCRSRF